MKSARQMLFEAQIWSVIIVPADVLAPQGTSLSL